jgi:hypothetical protein
VVTLSFDAASTVAQPLGTQTSPSLLGDTTRDGEALAGYE